MKIALIVAAVCIAACFADSESQIREKRQTQKPGRFLSLPVPKKCAERKFIKNKTFFIVCAIHLNAKRGNKKNHLNIVNL